VYPPGQAYPQGQAAPQNGFGVTALVTGIIGFVLSWIPVLNLILGVIATVFGAVGWRRVNRGAATNGGMAIAGLVLGILTLAITIVFGVVFGISVAGSS
jgi:hypothetical protein